jgi:hypothetical protein
MKIIIKAMIRTRYYEYDKIKREININNMIDEIIKVELLEKPTYERITIDNRIFTINKHSECFDFNLNAMVYITNIYRIADKETLKIALLEKEKDKRWYDCWLFRKYRRKEYFESHAISSEE